MLVLNVSESGPEPKKVNPPVPGSPEFRFEAAAREIRVQFGPQQIIGYATALRA